MAKHRTLQCQNCGAPLGVPEDHDRFFTCKYCGSVLEDVTPPEAKAVGRIEVTVASTPGIDPSSLATYAKPAKAVGCTVLAGILVAATAGIGGLVVAARSISDAVGGDDPVTASGSEVYSWAVAEPVPSGDGSGTDVVGIARTSDEIETVYLDIDAEEPVRWSVPRALEDETFVQFVPTEEVLVVSSGAELFALDRAGGAQAWTRGLSDVVQPNICTGCVQRFGDVVTTLTADGVLSASVLADGQQRWSVRLTETPRQIVDVGGNPAVLDSVEGTTELRVFSAADGSLLERLPLSCPDTTFGGRYPVQIYDHLVPVGDGTVLWFGDGPFGGCAQRWAAGGGGAPMWEVPYEHPNPSGIAPGSIVLQGGSALVAQGTTIDVLDLATGAPRRVAERPDVELSPIGVHEGAAVLAERTTRGTPRWSLVAVDLGTGGDRWRFRPEVPERIEASRSFAVGDAWTASVTGDLVSVVQFREEATELVAQTIPVATGTASAPAAVDLSDRSITNLVSTHGWSGDDLLFSISGSFLVLDGPTGSIAREIPVTGRDWARPVVHWSIDAVDPAAQRAFYGALFNWDISDGVFMPIEPGFGGPEPGPGGHIQPGETPRVTLYVQVRHLRESLDRAVELGGTIVAEPFQLPGQPTLAQITDPEGNPVMLVQQ